MSSSSPLNPVPITARYQLQCASSSSLEELESPFHLGPLDQVVFRGVAIQVVFVYKMPGSSLREHELIPVHRLRQALCRLLDYYPHLTGRLHFDPSSNAPEIRALGTGAELLEAHSPERLDSIASRSTSGRILITNLPGSGSDLLAPFDPTTEGVCRDPILAVKHTRFACGGVALGVRLHHIVCDAHGFFNFVNDLAELYRGLESSPWPTLGQPPEIRSIFCGPRALSPEQRQVALQYPITAYSMEDDSNLKEGSAGFTDAPPPADFKVVGRVLRFSSQDLAVLKAQATDPSGQGWVSTTEALSAYICQTVYRARMKLLQSQGLSPSEAASSIRPEASGSLSTCEVRNVSACRQTTSTIPSTPLTPTPCTHPWPTAHSGRSRSLCTS